MSEPAKLSAARFASPAWWPTWLLVLALKLGARLPYAAQLALGRAAGRVLIRCAPRRRRVAAANLALCFPRLGEAERDALLRRHFEALGISFFEMASGWYAPLATLERRVAIHGREHLDAAFAAGRGVLLVAAHFTGLETCVGALEGLPGPFSGLYSPQRNAMVDVMIRRGRGRTLARQLARDNVRGLIRALRDGHAVLYLPDQTYLGRQSVLLPFFGEPAVTNTAVPRLAGMTGAHVLTFFFRRLPGRAGYRVDIEPLPAGYPTGDTAADTRTLFARLEAYIEQAPEQYLWIYKKFKGRPPPHGNPYAEAPQP